MKLNQVIAIERGVRSKVDADMDEIRKAAEKPALFAGLAKTYRKKDEGGEDEPDVRANVQMIAKRALDIIAERWTELLDVIAQKDFANCSAIADVKFEDGTVISGVPTTFLLYLERQLAGLYTIVKAFPTLDPAERWSLDANTGLHFTEPLSTMRTKKTQRAIVLYPATPEHPAQTQIITEDISVGTWETVKYSGALPEPEHRALLGRIERAQQAVKLAREQANLTDAPKQDVGRKICGWLFKA